MSLPDLFEATREKLVAGPTAPDAPAAATAGGAPFAASEFDFDMQHQQQDEWCWAAVATSVSLFYDPASGWTQCEVAKKVLKRDTCCDDGETCNEPTQLDWALKATGNLRGKIIDGTTTYARLNDEIGNRRPLGCRIRWPDQAGHFVVVRGYSDNQAGGQTEHWLKVEDPWDGPTDITYDKFLTKYRDTGTWTHSYRTEP